MNNIASDPIPAVFAIKDVMGLDVAGFNGGCSAENFHGRTRFKGIGDRAIAPQLLVKIGIGVRIKKRDMGHGKNGTGLGFHDNGHSRSGGIFLDAFGQRIFGNVLNGAVNGQNDVMAIGVPVIFLFLIEYFTQRISKNRKIVI